MELNGKKTERMRLRVSSDMADEVRAIASLECRDLQDQMRFLLILGLEHLRRGRGNQRQVEPRAAASRAVPSESESKGQMSLPGTVGPILSQKKRGAA